MSMSPKVCFLFLFSTQYTHIFIFLYRYLYLLLLSCTSHDLHFKEKKQNTSNAQSKHYYTNCISNRNTSTDNILMITARGRQQASVLVSTVFQMPAVSTANQNNTQGTGYYTIIFCDTRTYFNRSHNFHFRETFFKYTISIRTSRCFLITTSNLRGV